MLDGNRKHCVIAFSWFNDAIIIQFCMLLPQSWQGFIRFDSVRGNLQSFRHFSGRKRAYPPLEFRMKWVLDLFSSGFNQLCRGMCPTESYFQRNSHRAYRPSWSQLMWHRWDPFYYSEISSNLWRNCQRRFILSNTSVAPIIRTMSYGLDNPKKWAYPQFAVIQYLLKNNSTAGYPHCYFIQCDSFSKIN